jgi:hypothetical protein
LKTKLSSLSRPELTVGRWLLVLLLGVLLTGAILTLDLWIVKHVERSKEGDFFQFWAGGRAILLRQDPYDPASWRSIYEEQGRWLWETEKHVFVYPLWTALPFVPLALLPFSTAVFVWALMNEALIIPSLLMWLRALSWSEPKAWLLLVLASGLAFEPVSVTVLLGHLGIVLVSLISGTLYLVSRGRHAQAGVLLGLTLLKPQLFLLVYPVLLLTMALRRKWSFLATFGITVGTLLASSWVLLPGWIGAWQQQVGGTSAVRLAISPTMWVVLQSVTMALGIQDLWLTMGFAGLAAVAGVVIYSLWESRTTLRSGVVPEPTVSLTVITSLLIAPYVLSYDFVLLVLPMTTCFWIAHSLAKPFRQALAIAVVGCGIILPWLLLTVSIGTGKGTATVLVPCSLLAILLLGAFARARTQRPWPAPEQTPCWHPDEM